MQSCCANDVDNDIKKVQKSYGGNGETSVDAESISVSSPAQPNVDSRKAKSLYVDLKKKHSKESEGTSFNASHGWFYRFKARANVKVSGEAVSADIIAAWEFLCQLTEIIEEGAYLPEQVF